MHRTKTIGKKLDKGPSGTRGGGGRVTWCSAARPRLHPPAPCGVASPPVPPSEMVVMIPVRTLLRSIAQDIRPNARADF